jgi:TatD DNase family protein
MGLRFQSMWLLDDLPAVLERSRFAGVRSMIITGGSLHESGEALSLAKTHGKQSTYQTGDATLIAVGFYATVGCHPTRSGQFDTFNGGPEAYLQALDQLISQNLTGVGRVVAVGECGLGATFVASLIPAF